MMSSFRYRASNQKTLPCGVLESVAHQHILSFNLKDLLGEWDSIRVTLNEFSVTEKLVDFVGKITFRNTSVLKCVKFTHWH